jgi:S-phase kinase-associated protein 1
MGSNIETFGFYTFFFQNLVCTKKCLEKISNRSDFQKMAALDEDVPQTLTLTSKDGQSFEVDRDAALISKLVKTVKDGDEDARNVNIPDVKGPILGLVVEYMKHHKGTEPDIIPKPLRSKNMKDVVKDPWDAEFIDQVGVDRQKLYDLVLAANYMDVNALLHLGCAKVASIIKGQPLEKIKELLSPQAEEQKE